MVDLNHTIVWCTDQKRSSAFLAEMLGLPAPTRFGHFDVITLANGISMDFANSAGRITPQGLDYWADPARRRPREINRNDGGRGVYFPDPDGHGLEVITRPYGSGS